MADAPRWYVCPSSGKQFAVEWAVHIKARLLGHFPFPGRVSVADGASSSSPGASDVLSGPPASNRAILRRRLVGIDAVASSKAVIYSLVSMNGPSVISTGPLRRRTVAASTTPARR
jgi:hypothetical protein